MNFSKAHGEAVGISRHGLPPCTCLSRTAKCLARPAPSPSNSFPTSTLDRLLYQHVPIEPAAPILLLIGDIGRFDDYDQYRDFRVHHSAHFEKVILVVGNYESYSSSRTEGLEAAEQLVREPQMNGKLLFLNRARFDVPDTNVTILGCTLHSHFAPDYTKLTHDFARTKDWRVADHNSEHEKDLAWLKSSIAACSNEQPQRRIVVATHYALAFEKTTHPANENNAISQCFSSHTLAAMKNWEGSRYVRYWLFGHTNWNARFTSGDTILMSNCRSNDSSRLSWWQKRFRYRPFDEQAKTEM
ncbi:hypothetical protein KC347_g3958 [Hortaea werneckii]|nr:hypothetical protein KC347_g3958 [Hortaea werneckii]